LTPDLRYAETTDVWYAGVAATHEKPPPEAKDAWLYETATSWPAEAQFWPLQPGGGLGSFATPDFCVICVGRPT